MLTKDELPECPVATTVQLIGSKWKLLILRNLMMRSMEEDGLITRTVYPEVPPRVEYALSDLGETMRPILDAMQELERIIKTEPYKQVCRKYPASC